jgi:putative hydrolase of the HAD superfamily
VTGAERPRGICFDYGRTLVQIQRPVTAIAAAGVALAEELSLQQSEWTGTPAEFAVSLDELLDQLIGAEQRAHPWHEVEFGTIHRQAMHQLLGKWPSQDVSQRVAATLQRAWVSGVRVVPEARASLATLRERGIRIGLCSNAPFPTDLMYEQLDRLAIRQYFDAVLFSSEIGWRKPDPRVFAELLARLTLPASSVWFVGDEWEADIQGARAAGMRAILAPGAGVPGEEAEGLGQWSDLALLIDRAIAP